MDDALLPTQLKNEKKCDFTHTLSRLFQVEYFMGIKKG